MYGLDVLGLGNKHVPLNELCAVLPSDWAIGCFIDTFGDAVPRMKDILRRRPSQCFRIHMWWDYAHKVVPIRHLETWCKKLQPLLRDFPEATFYVSHSCEYAPSTTKKELQERINCVKSLLPKAIPVNTPMAGGPILQNVLTERHHSYTKADIVSTDGLNAYDMNFKKWFEQNKNASIMFLWGARCNLSQSKEPNQPFIPPKERTAAPHASYFKSLMALISAMDDVCPQPTNHFAKQVTFIPFKRPFLYKTHAEDKQGETSQRALKPVAITPSKAPLLHITTYRGEHIGNFKYYGPYEQNLHRHYARGRYGYEIAEMAEKVSGCPHVWFHDVLAKVAYGPVHPALREGYYHE